MLFNSWCEISLSAIEQNYREFERIVGPGAIVAPVVKANAYGHGIELVSTALRAAGAACLCVNEVDEGLRLRASGDQGRLYVVGYSAFEQLSDAVEAALDLVVYNRETVDALAPLCARLERPLGLHLKLETGNNRQGLPIDQALELADEIRRRPGLCLEGVTTHFADIEDTTDHTFAMQQLGRFQRGVDALVAAGHDVPLRHCTNTAAVILFPETYFNLVRVGIGTFGMWPSKETLVTAVQARRHQIHLEPALSWKSRVAQVKDVARGEYIGYGRTYQTTHETRLAIVPVGYYDGYDRRLSNLAHVLVRGHRAPVRGRICMNMLMIDVTHVPDVALEDEVVLLGTQGEQRVSAEQLASWIGTINYEVTTRIHERLPRLPR